MLKAMFSILSCSSGSICFLAQAGKSDSPNVLFLHLILLHKYFKFLIFAPRLLQIVQVFMGLVNHSATSILCFPLILTFLVEIVWQNKKCAF